MTAGDLYYQIQRLRRPQNSMRRPQAKTAEAEPMIKAGNPISTRRSTRLPKMYLRRLRRSPGYHGAAPISA